VLYICNQTQSLVSEFWDQVKERSPRQSPVLRCLPVARASVIFRTCSHRGSSSSLPLNRRPLARSITAKTSSPITSCSLLYRSRPPQRSLPLLPILRIIQKQSRDANSQKYVLLRISKNRRPEAEYRKITFSKCIYLLISL
jgi:hypothetical protein